MTALTSGSPLGPRYRLVRRLGGGGMGEVWRVEDREARTEVAAKIVVGASVNQIDRLQNEWRLTRLLNHPGIVRVFDFERLEGTALLTMELVEGRDLGHWLGAKPSEIVDLMIPIAAALDHAHRAGVVHRDLKLSNVLVDRDGRPRLLDFGISGLESDSFVAAGGGSPASASPQQLDGGPPEPADDIYAFGTLLYELLSGKPPLWPDLTPERVRATPPAPIHSPHPLPPGLQQLVTELLEKQPENRPPKMATVRQRLETIRATSETDGAATAAAPSPSGEASSGVRLTPPPRIRPAIPTPPEGEAVAEPPDVRRHRRLRWGTGIAFAALTLIAITVFAFLPDWVASRGATGVAPPGSESEPPTGLVEGRREPTQEPAGEKDVADPARIASDARSQAAEWIERMESRGASIWAGDEFAAARATERSGGQLMLEGDLEEAAAAFGRAVGLLEDLEPVAARALQEALASGSEALARADSAAALEAYELAAMIEPGNTQAEAGLRRARALPELLAHLDAAAERERRGDLAAALGEYRQATAIEPGSAEARSGIARLTRRIEESDFSRTMAAGFEALEAGEFARGRDAFQQAQRKRPDSQEARDGIERAESGLQTAAIADHRRRAEAAAEAEDWHAAQEEYGQILELDPSLALALQGRDRSRLRAALADDLDAHLHHRQRLTSPDVLAASREVLDRAAEVSDPGPVLERQRRELEQAILAYSTPLRIVLTSDGLTAVEVYRVGPLGSFTRRELDLLPGSYTVVGRRSGFRDVRLKLEVRPGKAPEPLRVRCEVKI